MFGQAAIGREHESTRTVPGWSERGDRSALATVVDTKSSAPQPIGTKMAVNDRRRGRRRGLGWLRRGRGRRGRRASHRRRAAAAAALRDRRRGGMGRRAAVRRRDHGLGRPLRPRRRSRRSSSTTSSDRVRAALVTAVAGDGARRAAAGHRRRRRAAARSATPSSTRPQSRSPARRCGVSVGSCTSSPATTVFVDVAAPPPRLVIVGAVDFAAQLAAVASLTGWRAFVSIRASASRRPSASPPRSR